MYRVPSRRKRKTETEKPNLTPILDAVFIFIFFLLMSANFLKVYEIPSDVPIISASSPPKSKKKPLALTLKVYANSLRVYTGVPSRLVKSIGKNAEGKYDLETLHNFLIQIKRKNLSEKTIILEPRIDIAYEELVKIMDSSRELKKTDPALYRKGKDGVQEKVKFLFGNIVFGNIQS
jgi:biopolymer transport protein ExbD